MVVVVAVGTLLSGFLTTSYCCCLYGGSKFGISFWFTRIWWVTATPDPIRNL